MWLDDDVFHESGYDILLFIACHFRPTECCKRTNQKNRNTRLKCTVNAPGKRILGLKCA